MAPTSLFASVVLLWTERQAKAILRAVPFFEISHRWDTVVEVTGLRFGSYFVIWFLGCFALATVASVVNKVEDEGDDTAWIPDRHQRAREHLGPVFVAAWITFCAFLAGMAVSQFCSVCCFPHNRLASVFPILLRRRTARNRHGRKPGQLAGGIHSASSSGHEALGSSQAKRGTQ
jgi:hypothetical protein